MEMLKQSRCRAEVKLKDISRKPREKQRSVKTKRNSRGKAEDPKSGQHRANTWTTSATIKRKAKGKQEGTNRATKTKAKSKAKGKWVGKPKERTVKGKLKVKRKGKPEDCEQEGRYQRQHGHQKGYILKREPKDNQRATKA